MLNAPNPIEPKPHDPASAAPAWHGEMMRELAELGMRMARSVTVGAETRAQAGQATAADEAASTLALQRAAKTVRLTVALDKKLLEAPQMGKGLARAKAVAGSRPDEVDEAEARRLEAVADGVWVMRNLWKLVGKPLIQHSVELAVETEAEGADRERLLTELHETLVEREEELIALGPGQYHHIITDIMRGLGLTGRRLGSDFATAVASRVAEAANDPGVPRAVSTGPGARVHRPP